MANKSQRCVSNGFLFYFASKISNIDMKDLLFDTGLELSPPRPPDPSLLISQASIKETE
jgi:hypothetical protein